MSRDLTAAAQTEAEAQFQTLILLAKFEFDTAGAAAGNAIKLSRGAVEPAVFGASGNEYQAWRGAVEPAAGSGPVYVHSGIGSITFDGNVYTGVGDMGNISEARETESTRPTSLDLQLNANDSQYLAEALDAGNYGDPVTIYAAYRSSDGSIVSDPWVVWSGWFEFATITAGVENRISITVQHDLAVLEEKHGARFTTENQEKRFTGDLGFEFVHEAATAGRKLVWGGIVPFTGSHDPEPRAPGGGQVP